MNRIRKGDQVIVITGKNKGQRGEVIRVAGDRAFVQNLNLVKRHTKANPYAKTPGGIIEKEAPLDISNVALLCDGCAKPAKVGYKYTADGTKVRFCKKCNHEIA